MTDANDDEDSEISSVLPDQLRLANDVFAAAERLVADRLADLLGPARTAQLRASGADILLQVVLTRGALRLQLKEGERPLRTLCEMHASYGRAH